MQTAKKIIARIGLFAAVLVLLNVIYIKTSWNNDLTVAGGELLPEIKNAQDSADVIYFAESSNWSSHKDDTIKKSISEFASAYFPSLRFRSVQKGAIHAGIYRALINHIKENSRVKTLIVTMNLRSFDATWINSKLETPLSRSKVMYAQRPPLLNRFLLSLNTFENKTEEQRDIDMKAQWARDELKFPYPFKYKNVIEWDKAMGAGGYLKSDGSWDMPKIELACHNIKTYAFQINPETNPRIKDFDEIVKMCKEKKLNLVFNLMAENTQYADSLVGKELIYLIKQNRNLLMKRYNKDGVIVVDNLELVNGKDYIDQNWTTEHYKQRGRQVIAKNLANHLKQIYPKEFVEKRN
jgi:hypothetical protein